MVYFKPMINVFGDFIKNKRIELRLGLRDFCIRANVDPSNWSKIERGIMPPPIERKTLLKFAACLGIGVGTKDWKNLEDYAHISKGKIPDYVISDSELVKKLPIFWRGKNGIKPTKKELEEMIEVMREVHSNPTPP